MNNKRKEELYKTAKTLIGCAHFPAGTFVSVSYSHQSSTGVTWYMIDRTEHGPLPFPVGYPNHHLHQFCL